MVQTNWPPRAARLAKVRLCNTSAVCLRVRCAPLWQGLEGELLGRREQVRALQEISSQLLVDAMGEESTEAKEKVHVIANKLRLLLRQVAHDLSTLEARLVRARCHRGGGVCSR